ncbi:protein FAR1-RELATED SEQUENCE 5-like [Telopea speciosissima]|uniref:protein FAR1-RELATED SEQUENCE 5-like n=1 Tax=Telopea speciosissima TaxID=54955 RepID=UPI001CC3C0E6|nr:protein FAR1-RELATED SEQUENCE 5-like [Telopea speciosissima]
MRIKSRNGKWVVDLLGKEHNHPLVDPSQSFRFRSHQKLTDATMQLINKLHKCGIKQSDIISIVSEFAGGEQNGSVNEERCRNIFRTKRRKTLGVDCQLAVNYLKSKGISDQQFFYAISMDAEQRLIGLFWVDGRSREQYKNFGDVIVFDTTYKKNKYKFSFAPFTGVNHHMQCTLFGYGLIANETKGSFIWLFQSWLKAMDNVQPKSILTDEDPAIMRAIRHVFPSSVHHLCGWHLEKHRTSHMGPLYKKYPDMKNAYYSCIHDSKTIAEFEQKWDGMIERFNLQDHKWLRRQFKRRKHWVPRYFPDIFCWYEHNPER